MEKISTSLERHTKKYKYPYHKLRNIKNSAFIMHYQSAGFKQGGSV